MNQSGEAAVCWLWQGKETWNKVGVKGERGAGQYRVGWVVHGGATQTWMGAGWGRVSKGRGRGRQEQGGREGGSQSARVWESPAHVECVDCYLPPQRSARKLFFLYIRRLSYFVARQR